MDQPRVYIVHLRRPRTNNPKEMRSDPFWEFGSFGCTGCHRKNLLHPKNVAKLEGARLAFAQGGKDGFRLVYLTPIVQVRKHTERIELNWSPVEMPFKYSTAPILVSNDGTTVVPLLKDMLQRVARTTLEGAFSSCFRSRTLPLHGSIADQLVEAYVEARGKAHKKHLASSYSEALPYAPPKIDMDRRSTYDSLTKRSDCKDQSHRRSCNQKSC